MLDPVAWYTPDVVVWNNPVDENGESHADSMCDCYYAHPVCYHCDFVPPSCHQVIHTRFLKDSAIYIEGKPYLVLFCEVCYPVKEAHYDIVPTTAYDHYDAFVWLSAWYQSQHGSMRAPVLAPGPPPFVQHNPEDDYAEYDGFDYTAPLEDAQELDVSAIPYVAEDGVANPE